MLFSETAATGINVYRTGTGQPWTAGDISLGLAWDRAAAAHHVYTWPNLGGYSQALPIEGEPSLDEIFEKRTLSGSPTTVRSKLEAYQQVCGITALNCTFQLGAMEPETVTRSMRLFAEEVMPHFR